MLFLFRIINVLNLIILFYQTLGVDHVAPIRGAFQPPHRACRGAGLRGQTRDPHLAAEHWNAAPY